MSFNPMSSQAVFSNRQSFEAAKKWLAGDFMQFPFEASFFELGVIKL